MTKQQCPTIRGIGTFRVAIGAELVLVALKEVIEYMLEFLLNLLLAFSSTSFSRSTHF